MALTKNPKYDLKRKSLRMTETGLIISLALLIVAFKFFPEFENEVAKQIIIEENISLEDVEITRQEQKPPPPPKPPIPIEAPSDELLEDIEIEDLELDIDEEIKAPPPPVEDEDDGSDVKTFFVAVQNPPKIIGGIAAVQKNLTYPEIAVRSQVEGVVVVLAYITLTGEIKRVEITKGIGAGCDEAAAAAVQKVKFEPGMQRNKPVNCRVSIPVRFKIGS